MKMAVIGGGNIGTLMAAEMSAKGHDVTICSSRPDQWNRNIEVFSSDSQKVLAAKVTSVTSDLEAAVYGADIIWVTWPAQELRRLGREIEPFVCSGQQIVIVPGSGGAEFSLLNLLKKGCILLGLQRVHSIARIKEYGRSVYMLGRKKKLYLGSIPAKAAIVFSSLIEEIFDMPCIPLPNYLSVTLTPSNSVLHTVCLYSIFYDYKEEISYPEQLPFYDGWTDTTSSRLLTCDSELQSLCYAIPMDLQGVQSLKMYYESYTEQAMTLKIRSIEAFKHAKAPMKKLANGWIPDFDSRYFLSDFSFGLNPLNWFELHDTDTEKFVQLYG